jgi:hypothetical protein
MENRHDGVPFSCVTDGYERKETEDNAIAQAHKPVWDR